MTKAMARRGPVSNFGKNLTFAPRTVLVPADEDELLGFLASHRGRKIRAVGRLHSWSDAPWADDVLIDLREFRDVSLTEDSHGWLATIGGGCQIKDALRKLAVHGLTLPTVGLISEQSIAGAIATGTHGSGGHSLSHYVSAVRLAGYDPATDRPVIRVLRDGDELRAVRCSLGCLGIVVSVELRPRASYRVREWLGQYDNLTDVLRVESDAPLQQFFLVPWQWKYLGQHRCETEQPRSRLATLYRIYWFVVVDVALHLALGFLVKFLRYRLVKLFYHWIVPLTLVRGWHVVDRSQDMLIMEHELFVHIEIEMFVARSCLSAALSFVRQVICTFDGDCCEVDQENRKRLDDLGLADEFDALRGTYTHHYPVCVRRVLPDDTLLSMSSGAVEPYYALSFISYARPAEREGFLGFARFLSRSMGALFEARPHWGKICPLSRSDAERLYPHIVEFRELARSWDPEGRFQNRWTSELFR